MPWYNGKFFYDKDKINISEQRFNALPTQNNLLDDLLVFNNTTNEVNSRTVASIGAVGPTGATGVRGLDGNSSLWKHVDSSNYPSPGTGNFCLDGGNTYGDGDIVISRTDNFGTDMTNWLQNIEIGDIVTFRNYNSYEYFAIYVVSVSPATDPGNVTLSPSIPPDLLDAYGLPGTAGQNGAFEVDALYTIGYVKRGLQGATGPIGDTLNSSNWLWGSSNLSAFTSGQFTSFDSGSSSTNSLSNTTTIEINPVDRNGNTIGTGPSTSVGTYIATGWFGLFNTGDVLTVQYSENNYATYRLTKQPEWHVSSLYPPIIRLSVEFVNNGSTTSIFTVLEYGIGLVNGGMNAGLDYNFDEVTIPPSGSSISFGSIRLNNATQNASTEAYLSVAVANGNVVGNFINSWNSFGNNPGTRGFLQFKTNHNHDFLTFDVTNVSFTTTGGPHYIITLTNGIGAIGTPYINNELVSVNFIPAGAQGVTGATGATGAQGPAGPGSAVSNGTISFWSELGGEIGGTRSGPTAPMPIILAGPSGGPQQEIWPILPHGGGAFRDTWGTYIGGGGVGNRTPAGNLTSTYGEYMPFDGKVYAYGINFDNYSGAVSLPAVSYDIFVMNYTNGDIQLNTTVSGGPNSVSVVAGAGVPSLGFSAGDHIGLAVKYDGGLRCYMAVEGTIYFEYSYP